MRNEIVNKLKSIIGEDWVISSKEAITRYLYDETPPPVRPEVGEDVVVVKPQSVEEVSKIILLANEYGIPVFPRGGGTGHKAGKTHK